ncbi:MAG: hypothetical protein LBH64_02450, partial [Coriobacteriales bacterium]|nr:hypothetical protein [Coriobacteriales bacterium]
MGNQALALGALRAGITVASGYPGTPSSEIIETVAARAATLGLDASGRPRVHVEWSTNEKAALEVGAGAAFAGARALVTMKQVGLNVASDALMSLPYLGVQGGLVLVVCDDPGPISSQTEQDTRQFAQFAKLPLLDPATPEEALAMMPYAFDLSKRYATPVIVRPTTRVCHGTALIETDLNYQPHEPSGFSRGPRWVVFPRRAFEGHLEITRRLPQIAEEFSAHGETTADALKDGDTSGDTGGDTSGFLRIVETGPDTTARLGVVAGGISYAYLRDALAQAAGRDHPNADLALRLFKVGTPFPFPERRALAFLEGLSEVLVLEELEPVIERELLQLVGKHQLPVRIRGKLTGDTTQAGENSIALIERQLETFAQLPSAEGAGAAVGAGVGAGVGA